MARTLLVLLAICLFVVSLGAAGTGKKRFSSEESFKEEPVANVNVPYNRVPPPDWSRMTTSVGTFTTLTGFYDYQSNGGAVQHIRVNPANGNIHVTFMLADDSTAAGLNNARRTGYAFSSNGGTSWNNFSQVRVPGRRSGFAAMDLLKGPNAGLPILANHSTITGTQTGAFVDSPEGAGAFIELLAPPTIQAGTDEPIWPYIAGTSDGGIAVAASRQTAATAHYVGSADLLTWGAWTQVTSVTQSGGRYPVQANGTGRVGIVYNNNNPVSVTTGGNWFTESTNNGQTWSTPTNLYGFRVEGSDTFLAYVHTDFVYNGNAPLFAFSETHISQDKDQISFWSQATGFKVAVKADSTKFKFDPINQRFHALRLGWPSIGLAGSTIVLAFQAFQAEVDSNASHRYAYSDVWFVSSADGGNTWTAPRNLTQTPFVDERYPSVSKWNAAGQANIVWAQKSKSGLYAFPGGADTVRCSQVFYRLALTDVNGNSGSVANSFKLSQNYPNPFNPATKIDFTVAQSGPVNIKVFNAIGQEVATLMNEYRSAGSYQVSFDGTNLPSGVYIYKMTAGGFNESKKMVLMK